VTSATSVGAPTDSPMAGQDLPRAYKKAGYKEPAAAYGGYAYDAANAIIEALKVSLKDAATPRRPAATITDGQGLLRRRHRQGRLRRVRRHTTAFSPSTRSPTAWVADKTDTFK
jgi:branched-chain amino acid transport system substrate-binding protein